MNEFSMMIDIAELRKVFADKLAATGSLDAAFTKAVWVTYQRCMEMKGGAVAELERVRGVSVEAAAAEARRIYDAAYADGQADKAAGNCSRYMVSNAAPQMIAAIAAVKKGE